jgi:macrodomain Ter protein organizer (MatP/YcbG family)
MEGEKMKVLCVDMDRELWRCMKADAAAQGVTLKDYIANALERALGDPKFKPPYSHEANDLARKSVQLSEDLWERLSIAAAKFNISKKNYLSSAINEILVENKRLEKSTIQAAFDKFHQRVEDQLRELAPYKDRLLAGEDPGRIMTDMEQKFKIPALNDPDFNRQHPEVIKLYRTIAGSRESQKRSGSKEIRRR